MSLSYHTNVTSPRTALNAEPRIPLGTRHRYVVRLARDATVREDAYRLRYESYLSSGHIAPNHTGLFSDEYDLLPNCLTMVIYEDGYPVASVRTCTLADSSGQRSPAADAFPEEVRRLLAGQPGTAVGRGRGFETSRMVRSPQAANNQGLVFLLYRMAGYVAMMTYTQILFACVRSNHVPFYRRFGYEELTGPRPYPGLSCPMQLLTITRGRYDEVRRQFPVIDPYAGATGRLDDFLAGGSVELALRSP